MRLRATVVLIGRQALPEQGSAFDYWLNVAANVWSPWRDAFDTKQLRTGADLMVGDMVMANDSVAVQHFFMHTYSNGGVPTLVVGGAGVGKSAVSEWIIRNLPKVFPLALLTSIHGWMESTIDTTIDSQYDEHFLRGLDVSGSVCQQHHPHDASHFVGFHAELHHDGSRSVRTSTTPQTGSFGVSHRSVCSRRRKGVYGPALGRRCVLFIDDLASCHPVHGFIRSPLELIRHW